MIDWNWSTNQYWIDLEISKSARKNKQQKKEIQAELEEVLHLRSQFDYSFSSSAPPNNLNLNSNTNAELETPVQDYIVDKSKDIAKIIGKGYISNWLIATGTYLLNPVSPTDAATPGPADEMLGGILVATGWTLKVFW